MIKKIIFLILLIIILTAVIVGVVFFFTKNTETKPVQNAAVNPEPAVPDYSANLAADLVAAFKKATTDLNLPKESIVMVNAYAGDEAKPVEQTFETNLDTSKQFYMASTVKPLIVAAYIKLLEIEGLNYKVPLKFVDDGKTMNTIAQNISDKINYNYDEDILLDLYILPFFNGVTSITPEQVLDNLNSRPELVSFEFNLKDVITYTLGPSSNLGLTLLKSDLALKKYGTEEATVNAVEEYLNKILVAKGQPGSLVINKSTKSNAQQTLNSAYFYEIEYLFDGFYKNEFDLSPEVFKLMKDSMKEVSTDSVRFNRRHETKTIASKIFDNNSFNIVEKSGYIGFDFEAAPGLNKLNDWDTLPAQDGKRIVFYDGSAFARIYLTNGKFVQYNFSIATPVYISLDPHYEELNSDYLPTKNRIFDSLQSNISSVLLKYKDVIVKK